jgi:HAMP domain-containing protein
MKPIVAEQRCMRCHSDPALAPKELLDRYGDKNGFHRSVGEVIGTLTVSVPASVVMAKARNNTMLFIGMVILFLALLTLIVNVFFSRMVLKPIQYLANNADEISLGRLDTNINTKGGDEIAKLAKAFERMKISIKMAFDQLAK